MDEPLWVDEAAVLEFYSEQLAEFDGMDGVRNPGLLASALNHPRFVREYSSPKPDLARLAAAYAYRLAKNHPTFDGNKRTALMLSHTFLRMNGQTFAASQPKQVRVFLELAGGDLIEAAPEERLRSQIEVRRPTST